MRVYLRNLQTGEELYLGDPERVGEVLSHEAASVGLGEVTDTTDMQPRSSANAG